MQGRTQREHINPKREHINPKPETLNPKRGFETQPGKPHTHAGVLIVLLGGLSAVKCNLLESE